MGGGEPCGSTSNALSVGDGLLPHAARRTMRTNVAASKSNAPGPPGEAGQTTSNGSSVTSPAFIWKIRTLGLSMSINETKR